MPKLPRDADPRRVIRAMERLGFHVESVSGSHYKLVKSNEPGRFVVVPFHGKLRTGTLASILKAARIRMEDFLKVFMIL